MPDKVYGICGTNKCKREVVPMENVTTVTKVINYQSTGVLNEKVADYPSGFTKDNCVVLSTMFKSTANGAWCESPSDYGIFVSAHLSDSGIYVDAYEGHNEYATSHRTYGVYSVRITLLKIS